MPRMTTDRVEECLRGPHVAVLSVSRVDRSPIAVPIWYEYRDGRFWMVTAEDSVHGRALRELGRATLTIHGERYGDSRTEEWYVTAHGPVGFTGEDTEPLVRRMRRRYYRGARLEEWIGQPSDPRQKAAVLDPERLSGLEWIGEL